MGWTISFLLSALCLLGAVVFAAVRATSNYKRGRIFDPPKILFAGVVAASVILFFPICVHVFRTTNCGILEAFLISVHHMIRLFVVDGEFEFITGSLADAQLAAPLLNCYTALFAVLFVAAPILTFGFVLSFFKNISAYKRYLTHYHSDVYIFSQLNEKSLALAESLRRNGGKGRFLVFTDVYEKDEKQTGDRIEKARELGAVCFKKDIVTVNFSFHSKRKSLNFFTIGEDQSANISQALKLIERMKDRENTNLYVFSTQVQAEMLLANAFHSRDGAAKIKVRRVNEVQSLISRNLYENGYEKIFRSAYDDGSGEKKINAVVVGAGQHGSEMLKSLPWFCQMDGYLAEIHCFDRRPHAAEKFTAQCPELMQFSGVLDVAGETRYTIQIHAGVDVDTVAFDEIIRSLPRATYVFVALGDDDRNIAAAVKLRALYEQMGYFPEIQAVVYDSDKEEALTGVTNFRGQPYNIDFIGGRKSSYSEEVILDSDVEEEALKRHLKWGEESAFWQYNYNYKSSVASAIHRKMKILCGIPGIEKEPKDRTHEELWSQRILEHRRWNAYMRSEGYVYGGTIEKAGRNDLAKTHNFLVPFEQLPLKEQEKDDD